MRGLRTLACDLCWGPALQHIAGAEIGSRRVARRPQTVLPAVRNMSPTKCHIMFGFCGHVGCYSSCMFGKALLSKFSLRGGENCALVGHKEALASSQYLRAKTLGILYYPTIMLLFFVMFCFKLCFSACTHPPPPVSSASSPLRHSAST